MTTINRDEKCAACGLPRHAHWGAGCLASFRCSGFETSAATRLAAAAPDMLAALQAAEQRIRDLSPDGYVAPEMWTIRAAIAKAEGH